MSAKKETILKDLNFCKELMDRLVDATNHMYDDNDYNSTWCYTVIQSDIIRLRRELNNVKKKLDWDYKEE